MQVRVTDEAHNTLWVKTQTGGVTSLSYRRDGTLEKIIALLESALAQACGELNSLQECGDVAQENSAALAEMLDRQLLVDVRHDPSPNIRGLEERVPCGWRSEVDAIAGLPDRHDVAG